MVSTMKGTWLHKNSAPITSGQLANIENERQLVSMFACAIVELSLYKSSVSLPMLPISDHYTRGLSVECIPPTTLLVSNGCAKSNVVNSSPAHALSVPRILRKSPVTFRVILLTNKWTNIGVIELRFYIPVDTRPVTSKTFFLANLLAF